MSHSSSPSGDEPEPTPPPAPLAPNEFMDTVMARLAQQKEVQKATNIQLATLVAALGATTGATSNPTPARRHLFRTNPTTGIAEPVSELPDLPFNNTTHEQTMPTPTIPQEQGGTDAMTVREIAALKLSLQEMASQIHHVTSSAPQIDRVLAATSRTSFSRQISKVRLRTTDKLCLPSYSGGSDPTDHMTTFNIALGRANFTDEEKEAGYCQLFVESLAGPALTWFSRLPENSVHSFHDLSAAFLKHYIMFTRQGATVSDLWQMSQTSNQSLRDYMEKFKAVVSTVNIPDNIAVDALMNTLWVHSKFWDDLYRHPTSSLQDAIARSHNFIRMEEDTRAILQKQNASKQTQAKPPDTRQEPRQHASSDKGDRKKGFVYVLDEDDIPASAVVVREKGWNTWEREPESKLDAAPKSSSAVDLSKYCEYHKTRGHETKECKQLHEALLASFNSGDTKVQPPKPKTQRGNQSWTKNKAKKTQQAQEGKPKGESRGKGKTIATNKREKEDEHADASAEEYQSHNRRRVEVIFAQRETSSDEEMPADFDLREKLNRRPDSACQRLGSTKRRYIVPVTRSTGGIDLWDHLDKAKGEKPEPRDPQPLNTDLRERLNAKVDDLHLMLNQQKPADLRNLLDQSKESRDPEQPTEPKHRGKPSDLRTSIESNRSKRKPQINVIMGGSPHYGDSVRAIKNYRRQATMSKKWPLKPGNDPQTVFSAEDAIGVHSPHNDPLLVELGIGKCDVTKVLIDTGSSVDLIFQETLDKMGIDLRDMKPSTRSLTGFNGSSEIMLGTIRLPVYACGVVRMVKFSVISAKAHYNVILGTPWIHSMKAVASTYHQCVKFLGPEGKIQTLRGNQQAARDLLIATVKLQQATAHINAVAKPIERIYPQKEEILEVPID
ncbi:hypothetical protein N665_0040s0058 [Sinapis alba]|nr:hypothetical protein N665_0040s0058 [Sinapis alba]